MKIFERQIDGYSEEFLEGFLESTLSPSSFFDQPVLVRGVCFANKIDLLGQVQEFAENRLRLGTILFRIETMTPKAWRDLTQFFTHPKAEVLKIGFILPNLDLAPEKLQEQIAETIMVVDKPFWFATASDQRKLIPKLKLPFLVYLGLGPKNRMRFLAQSGQQLLIDTGSLKKAPQPKQMGSMPSQRGQVERN